MTVRYIKLTEVIERLGIDARLIERLETEALIHPKHTLDEETVLSVEDVDRIRVFRTLTEDLEVNLAGAEVVLHMREQMLAMHRQFDEILTALVTELRTRLKDS